MISKHIWRGGEWVDVSTLQRAPQSGPYIMRDTPAYISPVTRKMIDGRAARREDLKRSGCREVDPSEWKPIYRNPEFAKKHGKEVGGEMLKAPPREPVDTAI
jgi:hypothetical protein